MPRRPCAKPGAERPMDRVEDRLGLGRRVDHVGGALASLLPHAHIDDRQRKRGGLHDAGRGIADHAVHLSQQAPIRDRVEIHEDVGIGARFGQGARPFDERVAARIGVGIDTDQLARSSGKGREKCVRFRICVLENCHWMPRGQDGRLPEVEIQACLRVLRDRAMRNGSDDRAMARQPGKRGSALRPSR